MFSLQFFENWKKQSLDVRYHKHSIPMSNWVKMKILIFSIKINVTKLPIISTKETDKDLRFRVVQKKIMNSQKILKNPINLQVKIKYLRVCSSFLPFFFKNYETIELFIITLSEIVCAKSQVDTIFNFC